MLLGNQDLCVRFTICLICYVIFTVVQLEFFFEIFACTTDYLDNILILLQYSTLLHIYIGQWIIIFVLYELHSLLDFLHASTSLANRLGIEYVWSLHLFFTINFPSFDASNVLIYLTIALKVLNFHDRLDLLHEVLDRDFSILHLIIVRTDNLPKLFGVLRRWRSQLCFASLLDLVGVRFAVVGENSAEVWLTGLSTAESTFFVILVIDLTQFAIIDLQVEVLS